MRIVVIGILLMITQILESTLFQVIRIGNIAPNFMIMLIVSFALLRGSKEGAFIGAAAGLIYDCTFGIVLGPTAVTYALIGYVCGKFNKNFYRENFIIPILCTMGSSLFCGFSHIGALMLRGKVQFAFYIQSIIIPEMIYTIALSLIIYQLAYLVNEKIEKGERKSRNMF